VFLKLRGEKAVAQLEGALASLTTLSTVVDPDFLLSFTHKTLSLVAFGSQLWLQRNVVLCFSFSLMVGVFPSHPFFFI
jgi:hypothetical protein